MHSYTKMTAEQNTTFKTGRQVNHETSKTCKFCKVKKLKI